MLQKRRNKRGFTLVELMVVVAVMGILVLVAIPSYNAATGKVETGVCEANRRMVKSAITQYEALGDNPVDLDGKTIGGESSSDELDEYFEGGELPVCPHKDFTGYTITRENGRYAVRCNVAGHAAVDGEEPPGI